MTWWVDAAWDESDRKAQQLRPPDIQAWSAQLYRMVVFSELVYDTDRNDGNILYTPDWRLWMIDFTRAFRIWRELQHPEDLVSDAPLLLERLVALDKQSLTAAIGNHLASAEIDAVLARRDLIIERFGKLAASGATGK